MFTPGPWKYEATTKTLRSDPANYWLASMDSWDGAVDNEANAKLMASAPDLLTALDRLARAAEHRENTMGDPMRLIEVQAELREATKQARATIAKGTSPR